MNPTPNPTPNSHPEPHASSHRRRHRRRQLPPWRSVALLDRIAPMAAAGSRREPPPVADTAFGRDARIASTPRPARASGWGGAERGAGGGRRHVVMVAHAAQLDASLSSRRGPRWTSRRAPSCERRSGFGGRIGGSGRREAERREAERRRVAPRWEEDSKPSRRR